METGSVETKHRFKLNPARWGVIVIGVFFVVGVGWFFFRGLFYCDRCLDFYCKWKGAPMSVLVTELGEPTSINPPYHAKDPSVSRLIGGPLLYRWTYEQQNMSFDVLNGKVESANLTDNHQEPFLGVLTPIILSKQDKQNIESKRRFK